MVVFAVQFLDKMMQQLSIISKMFWETTPDIKNFVNSFSEIKSYFWVGGKEGEGGETSLWSYDKLRELVSEVSCNDKLSNIDVEEGGFEIS